MAMNINKGLFRVWVVGTVVWVPFSALQSLHQAVDANIRENPSFGDLIPLTLADYGRSGLAAASLPLLSIVLFWTLRWILRGFKE